MCRHRVSPFPFSSSSSHIQHATLQNNYTYSHPKLTFFQYTNTDTPPRNEVCPSGAQSKIDQTNAIYPRSAEPEASRVQGVGIKRHMHTHDRKQYKHQSLGIMVYLQPLFHSYTKFSGTTILMSTNPYAFVNL